MDKELDKIADDIGEIKQHLAVYNEQLKYHIKRSDQADSAIKLLDERIQPIEKHVLLLNHMVKLISVLGGIVLFFATIYTYIIRK